MAKPRLGSKDGNSSVASQAITAATPTVITGSTIPIPAGGLRIGTVFRFTFAITKTAAGITTSVIVFQLGTAGSVADADILTFTLPVGTAVADAGWAELVVTIRGPLGGSCIAQGVLAFGHNGNTTGLINIPMAVLTAVSGIFNSGALGLIASIVFNTGASQAWTITQVVSETANL